LKKYFLNTIFRHIIIWTFALSFWTLLREFGQEVVRDYETLPFSEQLAIHLVLGLFSGLLFGSLEYLYEKYVFRNMGFGKAVFLGSLGYVLVIVLIIVLALIVFSSLSVESYSAEEYWNVILSKQTILLTCYFFIVGTFTNLFREIDKKFGRGNLWIMFRGDYYTPKEEEKIFLFLDLKSSTQTAETIGHFKYSKMLQDCFRDLGVVDTYAAEIYQYVGDEAVLSWDLRKGIENNNCIMAFYAFKSILTVNQKQYLDAYGIVPEFKAGIHLGKVVTAEIGELKREIAHHGDTINTAARIQEKCNILGKELLISEETKNSLMASTSLEYHDEGEIRLKGKAKKVRIFSVYNI
tara:strand:+ start:9944 stop:10996 length:1053 start_codon:yes stop_codon:yes gene_type:complete